MTHTTPLVPTPAAGFVTRMVRADGTKAVWPIVHYITDVMNDEQHRVVAETPDSAREILKATGGLGAATWKYQWDCSKDADDRFVYTEL